MCKFNPKRRTWTLPSFSDLIEIASDKSLESKIEQSKLNRENIETITAPEEICREFDFDILLVDLSVIRARDYVQVLDKPAAASHILCLYDDEKNAVIRSYNHALLFLAKGTRKSGNDPIVAHPELYQKSCVAVMLKDQGLLDTGRQALEIQQSYESFSWLYKKGGGKSSIYHQAQLLVTTFEEGLCKEQVSFEIRDRYNDAVLVIIPIMRPDIEPMISGSKKERKSEKGNGKHAPDPAGALFLIVKANKNGRHDGKSLQEEEMRKSIEAMSMELSRELTLNALKESYGELSLQRARAELYEGIGHTLKGIVQITGWEYHYRDLREIILEDPTSPNTTKLNQAANSLALFACAQGMGELVRLTALLERGHSEDYKKIADWVNKDMLHVWDKGNSKQLLAIYEETLFSIAKAMCLGRGWQHIEITTVQENGEESVRSWMDNENSVAGEVFDPKALLVLVKT